MSADFWPWWWGGLAVGALATLYPLLSGRALGVSSLYAELFARRREPDADLAALEAALLAETEAEFGPSADAPKTDELARIHAQAERLTKGSASRRC